ncbi:MAG TPA: Rid family hydrolase, partial [Polyangiaceae bacterium]|nr:Rid family hydrolase [Polyangiaceae bacterium]
MARVLFMAKKRPILTQAAPKPIGPYAQAIRSGKLLFLSGQIPIEPQSGQLVAGGIQGETRQ